MTFCDIVEVVFFSVVLLVLLTGLMLAVFNKYLPVWFCNHMGWHLTPKKQGNDGCSNTGVCPRCGKPVLQDSQGNWF